ncbi:MAG: hypothetical protein J7M26_01855 [Armatimonadetes bacterium]|nr:hypothetical protein [Armatimonadota bacterium]
MTKKRTLVVVAVVFAAAIVAGAQEKPAAPVPMIADYDAELRGADGHVDIPLLLQQLKNLGVNCYFWLIWHADTDWEDLHAFLPKAEKAGLEVWVYLTPPSEPPPPKPFGLDFVRWGQEIARLSLKHKNLRGWVIDDFYANHTKLTPDYIRQVEKAAKAINPKLLFYPLMYYREIHYAFADAYAPVIDGVVVAYPRSRAEIVRASRILRDEIPVPPRCAMVYPWSQPSAVGEMVQISRTLRVLGKPAPSLQLQQRDLFVAKVPGYHFKQILVDGQVVWEEDVAGGDLEWHGVDLDLSQQCRGKKEITLALRCYDKKRVSNFGVQVEWGDLRLQGLEPAQPDLGRADGWEVSTEGHWQVEWHPKAGGNHRYALPYIVMPAGSGGVLKRRLPGSQGTSEELAAHIKMILEAVEAGEADGMAIYCLPKKPGNPDFEAVRKVIAEMKPRLLGDQGE